MTEWLSVTYAGLSTQAIDAIRDIKTLPRVTTPGVVAHLAAASAAFNGQIDFLVSSHEAAAQPRLVKITSGQVIEGADFYWIGNQQSAIECARMNIAPITKSPSLEFVSPEEREIERRFHAYVDSDNDPDVGGAVINCLGSPYGHCYQDHAGSRVDCRVIPDTIDPAIRKQMDIAGMDGYFTYHVMSSSRRGVAVVGLYFEQAGMGYIHTPLVSDDPEKVRVNDRQRFQAIVDQAG